MPTDFFETSAMLITFILLGKYLEATAKVRCTGEHNQTPSLQQRVLWQAALVCEPWRSKAASCISL